MSAVETSSLGVCTSCSQKKKITLQLSRVIARPWTIFTKQVPPSMAYTQKHEVQSRVKKVTLQHLSWGLFLDANPQNFFFLIVILDVFRALKA